MRETLARFRGTAGNLSLDWNPGKE